jgi:hypothetical protein
VAVVDKLDEDIEIFSYCYLHGTNFIKWIPVHLVVADPVKEMKTGIIIHKFCQINRYIL